MYIIQFLGAGSIFDLKQNIEVDYYPKSENQTNAIQVSTCEKIMASVNATCIEKKKKEMGYRVIGFGEQVSVEEFNRLLQIPDQARKRCFNEGDLTIYCEKPIIRQMLLCFGNQYNRLINYDKFGVEEKSHISTMWTTTSVEINSIKLKNSKKDN